MLADVQAEREKLTQLMFEEFNVAGLFLADQAVLSLYAIGKLSGLVVDMGHGKTGPLLACGDAMAAFSGAGACHACPPLWRH